VLVAALTPRWDSLNEGDHADNTQSRLLVVSTSDVVVQNLQQQQLVPRPSQKSSNVVERHSAVLA